MVASGIRQPAVPGRGSRVTRGATLAKPESAAHGRTLPTIGTDGVYLAVMPEDAFNAQGCRLRPRSRERQRRGADDRGKAEGLDKDRDIGRSLRERIEACSE